MMKLYTKKRKYNIQRRFSRIVNLVACKACIGTVTEGWDYSILLHIDMTTIQWPKLK